MNWVRRLLLKNVNNYSLTPAARTYPGAIIIDYN